MKARTTFNSFLARTATTLLVMMLTLNVQTARADEWPEYISDVMLIGGSGGTTNTLKTQYQNQGWTVVDYDLNKGCGSNSDFIFLIYKKASRNSTNQGYITDFYVTYHDNKDDGVTNLPTTVNHNYKEYTLCPYVGDNDFVNNKGDLNSNAGGKYIHLYYTKKNFDDKRAVTDITFDDSSDYALEWNDVGGNDEGRPADLNKGCGSSSHYIYMHLTTATKTNRPTTDPVLEDHVYNGAAQQLIKTPATIAVGTMYYRIGTSGSFTSTPANVTAKNAGTYTVYYYADGDGVYGNQSATHSQTVTISKSPNDQVTVVIDPCLGSDKPVSPSCSGNLSSGTITYQYATAENGTYTSSVPTTPGTYWVKAVIAGDNNCEAFTTASKKFMKVAWKGSGTTANPLLISSTTDLDLLATEVNGGNKFQGLVFKVTKDIDYSYTTAWDYNSEDSNSQENNYTTIGNDAYPFCGTFDGAGYTIRGIRFNSRTSRLNYGGIFGYISNGAIVKDLTLADTRIYIDRGYPHIGGIAGKADKNSTITNCHVKDNVALFLRGDHQYGGGIVGYLIGTVSQCTSAATLSFTMNSIYVEYGGIAGYCEEAILTDNFVLGATLGDRIQYMGAIAGFYTNTTFARNYYAHCTKDTATTGFGCNCKDITDNDGAVPLFSLTLAEGISATATATVNYGSNGYYKQGTKVTLSGGLDGTPPIGYAFDGYSVNGEAIIGNTFDMPAADVTVAIALETAYTLTLANGITATATPASSDGETDYYKAGTIVTLSGGLDGATNGNPYCYIVNGFCLSGNTFTMPAVNATVVAAPVPTDWNEQGRDGDSEETAYLICSTEQLNTLANHVNDGTSDYAGKYFRLMNDLTYAYTTAWDDATSKETNYTPIGNSDSPFLGHFLGDGHTISGFRVYRGGDAAIDGCLALFGNIGSGAEVSGVTIADARITGYSQVSGIVGSSVGTITDCHVEADVTLHAVKNGACNFGGIVGYNNYISVNDGLDDIYSIVSNCTSAVTITVEDGISNLQSFGGIVGSNTHATITSCRAEGAVVPAVTNAGAIVGLDSNENTTLSGNTYHSCLVGNNAFNIGVGYKGGAHGDVDGARFDASALRLEDCRDNTALIAAYTDPENHTAYNGTAPNFSSLAVTLHGRTLYMDGDWNTLCLPFDVSDFSGTPLAGATVMSLDKSPSSSTGYDAGTKTLTLNFLGANTIETGHPYIVKKTSADASTLTFRARNGTRGLEGEGHSHLVDGKPTKKWCTDLDQKVDGAWFCEFIASVPVCVTGYTLTTGDDIRNNHGRNPSTWSLQAKMNSTDAWTVIDSRNCWENGEDGLPRENTVSKDYDVAADLQGTYQYFRFEVKGNLWNNIMELGELTLQGTVSSILSPTFYGVTLNAAAPTAITSADGAVSFVGSYSRYKTGGEDKSLLYLGAENTLYYPSTAMTIGAFRAWFRLSIDDLDSANGINAFVLNFDNDEASGIVDIDHSPLTIDHSDDAWYSIDGRKLSGKPTQKGIYIHNGRKVRL